ncbi:bifunctional ADP-dependent NAD(P)H-hydrate dehydratase/NAD(P)H-hydrate epimerase [Cellulophaga fucicola]|uniref:Bifunctional NAD(P)H-hydrate repair enzyme n=1 Tax=Cellulophaga fucicola TaxID=76595 RepID=A0A1K1LQT1_9FLAO|nr:bifunctional ADP-dependent NAD(P)H-hydrate dehydratase/NAD(P)H-hydrate epimerase [Cellulophaga fucicola]SFW13211.1 yjeF C-terminal region, hydroxyethylthiazole kinase-related/yjeF N-terminal region [Cellulophaga fucicola]
MKIFTGAQIYEADKFTIEKQQITSDELMERVATQIFNWLHLRLQGAQPKIHLFCGIGNNGGDGLAVARHLQEHGYNIEVYIVNYNEKRTDEFLTNLKRLKDRNIWPNFLTEDNELPQIAKEDIVLDAIFGIGLNRAPVSWVAKLMNHINNSQAFILAVDVPSGLFLDKVVTDPNAIIHANHILTFQSPKLAFFLPETGIYFNQWEILDIGIDAEYIAKTETEFDLVSKNEVLQLYLPREKFAHKGTYGHSLIIGGGYGKVGATILASKGALNSGSGLVSAYLPRCGYIPMQTAMPEVMVQTSKSDEHITDFNFDIKATVIGIGPGLGQHKETVEAFSKFLETNTTPLVVDADALNILSNNKKLLELLPEDSVLTPHPKELERLIGEWSNDFDKLEKAKAFSGQYKCVLVIKGAHTITLYKGKGFINTSGNPGMATAGSGDVLTGVITGFIAQGYSPVIAAVFGVYLHGSAGDLAVESLGYQSLTASNIANTIGGAFIELFRRPEAPQAQEQQQA